ncbi:hypothetical protein ATCC90586_010893 [Pythium insidiosum]|nr:hypothetical protein ATCC90586_010893 [Pythium insidiosum]
MPRIRLVLSSRLRRAGLVLAISIQLLLVVFLVLLGCLYRFLASPTMTYYASLLIPPDDQQLGDHFDTVYLTREALEISTQFIQLYRSSSLLTKPWRVLCLIINCLLTVGMSVALPLAICLPHVFQYDRVLASFPDEILYSPPRFISLVRDFQSLIIGSSVDGMIKLTPLVSLWYSRLPAMLRDIEFSVSNLTELPSDLDDWWPPMTSFYIEHSWLTEFPDALLRLPVDDLSLVGNRIESLESFKIAPIACTFLALTGNPIRSLPHIVSPDFTIEFLMMDNTLVEDVPSWVVDLVYGAATFSGTPFCGKRMANDTAAHILDTSGMCAPSAYGVGGRYPLDLILELRPWLAVT